MSFCTIFYCIGCIIFFSLFVMGCSFIYENPSLFVKYTENYTLWQNIYIELR